MATGSLRIRLTALCGLLLAAGLCRPQALQNSIVGTVRDASGALVPEARVSATNRATNVSRSTSTDAAGNYIIPSLIVGEYDVRVEHPGFKSEVRRGVIVQADQAVRADFSLAVGALTESIEVTATQAAPLLRTENASIGMVVSQTQVQNLPLKGRNFAALAAIVPGATGSLGGNQNSLGRTQALNLSVNGQRHFDNNYRLDGISMIGAFVNGSTYVPSLEALEEVNVETGQYSSAFGSYSGAQVNMVVKSGGNQVHGSLFEYLRNNALNARNFFDAQAPPPFRYNQFGATLGGPVYVPGLYQGKDRSFFFFGYEGVRVRRQSTGQGTVPTDAMRSGDFSSLLPRTVNDPFTKQPFPGNIIPAQRIAPQAQKLLAYIPRENAPGRPQNFVNTASNVQDEDQYIARIDHNLSPSDTLFFRAALRRANFENVTINPNFRSLGDPTNHNYTLSETHIFSPRVFNEFKVSYVRESVPTKTGREGADIDPLRDFGIKGIRFDDPLLVGIPAASISGYLGTGENFSNPRLLYSAPAVQNHLHWQLTGHTLRTGGEYFRRRQDFYSISARNQGAFNFTGRLTGNAFADFLLGLPESTAKIDVAQNSGIYQRHAAAYLQDDWRVRPNLTLNLGLRYEYAGSYSDKLGRARNLDWNTLSLFPEPFVTAPLNDPSNTLAPRFGLAFRVPNGTVIRGGYGLFYTLPTTANVSLLTRNPPISDEKQFFTNLDSPDLTLEDGFRLDRLRTGAAAPPSLITIPHDYGPGYAQMWNLNLQQPLPGGWVGEVGYVGSHTLGLDNAWTANNPPPGPGNVDARRPIRQYSSIRVFSTDAVSYYQGLQTRLQTRNWHGLNLLAGYTWSKCIDIKSNPATSSVGTEDSEPQNQYDRHRAERGRCAIDFTHVLKIHGVYEIPAARFLTGLANRVLGGWRISASLNVQTGEPFSIIVAGNPANTGRGTIRANRLADGNLPPSERRRERWFDTAAFVVPPLYTFGTAGRNIIEAPASKVLDVSLIKDFRFTERHRVEFRAEFFNALNTTQFNVPGRVVGTVDFGMVTSADVPREIQFALRYRF